MNSDAIYEYVESNGLPLVRIDGALFILDTGAPASFLLDEDSRMRFKTLPFELPGNLLGIRKEDMDRLTGQDVAGFIGFDIIKRYGLTIDRGTRSVLFEACSDESFRSFPVEYVDIMGMGFITMGCGICGRKVKALFDTGASIGYVSKALAKDMEYLGEVEDFGPAFGGEIRTKKYAAALEIGDCVSSTELAEMTASIELQCRSVGCKAIIGLNDFEWERIVFEPEEGRISYL